MSSPKRRAATRDQARRARAASLREPGGAAQRRSNRCRRDRRSRTFAGGSGGDGIVHHPFRTGLRRRGLTDPAARSESAASHRSGPGPDEIGWSQGIGSGGAGSGCGTGVGGGGSPGGGPGSGISTPLIVSFMPSCSGRKPGDRSQLASPSSRLAVPCLAGSERGSCEAHDEGRMRWKAGEIVCGARAS